MYDPLSYASLEKFPDDLLLPAGTSGIVHTISAHSDSDLFVQVNGQYKFFASGWDVALHHLSDYLVRILPTEWADSRIVRG